MGGVYAELTDSSRSSSPSPSASSKSSKSSKSDDDKSTGSRASKASRGPVKFVKVREKLIAKSQEDAAALERMNMAPRCQACGEGFLKPDAVYFGESLPQASIRRAVRLSKAAKAFLIVGTSGSVAPACTLPRLAKVYGKAKVIEISPRETDLSDAADLLLLGTAANVLPQLVEAVQRKLRSLQEGASLPDDTPVAKRKDAIKRPAAAGGDPAPSPRKKPAAKERKAAASEA